MHQRLDEDKMKFLINATHDIRSPLTLIMGPLQKLRSRALDSESLAELAVIDRNAQRILTLVNQILDVRKIDKQQMHLHCRETNMHDFIATIYKIYEYNARERGINFTFTGAEDITAWVDRTQFDKVVSNLLSNAFKYSFDHGDISIRLTEGHDEKSPQAPARLCRDQRHRHRHRTARGHHTAPLRAILPGTRRQGQPRRGNRHRPEPMQDDCRHAPRHHQRT